MDENHIGTVILDSAFQTHRELGPGLLETVYEVVLAHELKKQGLIVERQVPISVRYRDIVFEEGFRADIVVERKVILELKCIDRINNSHKKQLLTYLRLSNMRLGYLLNFSAEVLRQGIYRVVNQLDGCDQHLRRRAAAPPRESS